MLGVKLCRVKLANPAILASGILGTTAEIISRAKGAGCLTTKSIGPVERIGNSNPSVYDWGHGLINAIGLPSPGYKNMDDELSAFSKIKMPWIASIYGSSTQDYARIAGHVSKFRPSMIELNMSCPNKCDGAVYATDCALSSELVSSVKKVTDIPIIAKLTALTNDIGKIAKSCESSGADAINVINTVLGMLIDTEAKRPVLGYRTGGLSGPAVKPIAVRCVYQVYDAVKIPVIGTGGIMDGRDAIEMMMAGASAVGVGSAVYYRGPEVFKKITDEMQAWLKNHRYSSVSEIVGIAHGQ